MVSDLTTHICQLNEVARQGKNDVPLESSSRLLQHGAKHNSNENISSGSESIDRHRQILMA
jgi:hypothetical protein